MNFYKWSSSIRHGGYMGINKQDDRKICWWDSFLGDPLPPLSQWSTPTLKQYLGEEGKKQRKPKVVGDSPFSIVPLVSQRAADALKDIFDRHALLYPVMLNDASELYYMVVVKTVLDCIDRERSLGKLQKYGKTPDYFAVVDKWVFHENIIGDNDMFAIPDNNHVYYVSERFKNLVKEAGLKGFCLKMEFWEEKPWIS